MNDMQNSKAIFIIGSNPAVNHPVGFQHMLKAKEKGAKIIVIDPRCTRTAVKADIYARIRPGTDIAFIYGMLNIIFKNGWEDQDFIDTRTYGIDLIREEAAKWTPELTENVTGIKKELLHEITKTYSENRPGTVVWAMGLTQHSIGSSNTRIAPILQLVLGNMGKPGGGTNILRGHDNVQGATDMGCLSDNLPGYYGMAEGSWKYFATAWGVDYDYLVSRFASKDMMSQNGYTLAAWWAGVTGIKDGGDPAYNAGTKLRAMVVMGNGITSVAQQAKVKEGLDGLDLLVLTDPFINEAAVLTDRKDNLYILPAASQFETSGTVVATNRSVQWRYQVVEPLYESKPDQEFIFELAKKFGFYDELVRGMKMGVKDGKVVQVKDDFVWPEDATNEIARCIKTIGMTGVTAERVKAHTDNWDMFDEVSIRGTGKFSKEFYGLPWPCWSTTHSGTPNLYNVDVSVNDGGGCGFRNNFGLEHNGVNQLAEVSVKDAKIKGGYPEITKDNIEQVLGITLTPEEKEIVGANWKVDFSQILVTKCLEANMSPYGNARARAIVWGYPDPIPLHREPIHSPRSDLAKTYTSYEDKKNHFRVDIKYKSLQLSRDWEKDFPINLVTGRLVHMSGAGVENRASKYLAALSPEMFVDINPELAGEFGIKNGDMVWIHSPEGTKIKVKARFTHSVSPDRVFLPFHFAGHFQGVDLSGKYPDGTKPYAVGESANTVTNYGYDIITQIPETKGGLCRIEKA